MHTKLEVERMLVAACVLAPAAFRAETARLKYVARGAWPARQTSAVTMEESDAERRERLGMLFGKEAAERMQPTTDRERLESVEVQMLEQGMRELDWGSTRLVDVDMAAGPLEIDLRPIIEGSQLLCVRLDLPMGMLLEEEDGLEKEDGRSKTCTVAELFDSGSARPSGVRLGDMLRATTAVKMAMSYPAWQLMLGGIGKPSLQKILFATDGQPFDVVLAAISSNSREQQGNGQAVLLLERPPASSGPRQAGERAG